MSRESDWRRACGLAAAEPERIAVVRGNRDEKARQ